MVNFIYRDGDKQLELNKLPIGQRSMIESMQDSISKIVKGQICKRHENNSHITIVLNVGESSYEWYISDACCTDFIDSVEPKIKEEWH